MAFTDFFKRLEPDLMPVPIQTTSSAMATILAGTASRTNAIARPDSPEQDPYDPTQPYIVHSGYSQPIPIDMDPTDPSGPNLYDLPAIQQSDLAAALAEQAFDYSDGDVEYEYNVEDQDFDSPWPYIPPDAYETKDPVPYPPEHGEALLADALVAGWPLPEGMVAPDQWALGAPVVPGVSQLSLPCELAAEASLVLHQAQTQAFDRARQGTHRKHFSIPDVLITPDPDEGGEPVAELTVEPQRRRSMLFSQCPPTDQSAFDAPPTPPDSDAGDDSQGLHWAHITALAHGRGTSAGLCQSSGDLLGRPQSIPPTAFDGDWDSSSDEEEQEEENWAARHAVQSSYPTQTQALGSEQGQSTSAPLTNSPEVPILAPQGPMSTFGHGVPGAASIVGMTGAAAGAAVFASWAAAEEQSHPSQPSASDTEEHPVDVRSTQPNTYWTPVEQEVQPAVNAVDDLTLVPSRRAPAPPPLPPLTEPDPHTEVSIDVEADPAPSLEEPVVQPELTPTAQLPSLLEHPLEQPVDLHPGITELTTTDSEHSTASATSAPEPASPAQPTQQYRSPSPYMPGHSVTTSISSTTDVWATPRSSPLASPIQSPIQSFGPGPVHEFIPKLDLDRLNPMPEAQVVHQSAGLEQQSTTDVQALEEDELSQQVQTEAHDSQPATDGSLSLSAEPSTPRPVDAAPLPEPETQAPQVELPVAQDEPEVHPHVLPQLESKAGESEVSVEPEALVVDTPAQPQEPRECLSNAEPVAAVPPPTTEQPVVPVSAAEHQPEAPLPRSTLTLQPTPSPADATVPIATPAPLKKPAPQATAPTTAQASAPILSAPTTRPRRSSWSSWFGLRKKKEISASDNKHDAKHSKPEPKYDPKPQFTVPSVPPAAKAPSHLSNRTTEVNRTGPPPTLPALNVGTGLSSSPFSGLLGSLSSSASLAGSTTHLPRSGSPLGSGTASVVGLDSSFAAQTPQTPPVVARSGSPRSRTPTTPPRAQSSGASGAATREDKVEEVEGSDAVRLSYTVPSIELDFPWLDSVPTGGSPTASPSNLMTPTVSHESIASDLWAENSVSSEVPAEVPVEVSDKASELPSKPVTASPMELNDSVQGTIGQSNSHSVAATVQPTQPPDVKVRPATPELDALAPKATPVGAGAPEQVAAHTALVDPVPSTVIPTTDYKPQPPQPPQPLQSPQPPKQAAPKPLSRREAKIAVKQAAKAERAKAKAEAALLKELQKVDRMVRQHDAKMAKGQAKQAHQRDKSSKSSVPSSPVSEVAAKLGWESKSTKSEHPNERRRVTLRKLLKLVKTKDVPAERSAKSATESQHTLPVAPTAAPGGQLTTFARRTTSRPKSRPTSWASQNGRRVSSSNGKTVFVARTSSTPSRATVHGRLPARPASRTQGLGTNLVLSAPLNPSGSDDEGWINTDPSYEVDVSGVSSSDAMTSLAGSIDAIALNQARRGGPSSVARSSLPYAPIIEGFGPLPDPTLPMGSHLGSGSGSGGNASESPVEWSGSQAESRQSSATTFSSPPPPHGDTHTK